jgi:glutamate-ammonia-ligase adenylyltransferase
MVFLYQAHDNHALTNGNKPMSILQFYARLGQRIRHILDTKMLSGVLYEVDLRLRPSGHSGLLVAHINSYETYLRQEAWTWEHQALVRGRFIAGDLHLQTEYEAIRQRILSLPRNSLQLKQEVREMREKMRAALANTKSGYFDLKHSKGGIADIEFIVQFAVLDQTIHYPQLAVYTDNLRLISLLATQGFFTAEQAHYLTEAYCCYRNYGHRQVLQDQPAWAEISQFQELRTAIDRIWEVIIG